MNIGHRLRLVVLAVVIPMLLLSAGIVWWLAESELESRRQAITYSAQSIMSVVDSQLGKYIAVVQALATSPSLENDDLIAFRAEAARAFPTLGKAWIVMTDPTGQQLVNLLAPPGAALPRRAAEGMLAQNRAFATKQLQISNVFSGAVARSPIISIEIPVFRDGEPRYLIAVAVDTAVFFGLMNNQRLPEGWLAGVIDRQGNFVARSLDHERWVGKPASSGWRAIMNQEGWFEFPTLEGDLTSTANVVSSLSGWAVAIAAKKATFEAPIRQTILVASLAGLLVTLTSVLFATWAARRITQPIKALERGAEALQRHEPISFSPTSVPEIDHALQAFGTASKALIEHEQQRLQSEQLLKASEEQLRLFVDQAPASIAMFDREMRYMAVSRRFLDHFGPNVTDVIGRSHYEVFPEIPERWKQDYNRCLRGESLTSDEEKFVRADGRTQWVHREIRPWHAADGSIGGLLMFSDDVTQNVEARAALRASEERLRAIVDTATDGIIVADESGIVQSFNPAAERIFGHRAEEVIGNNVGLLMPEPHRSTHDASISSYCRTGVAKIIGIGREVEGLHKDGTTFPIDLAVAQWSISGKRFFTGIIRDITARQRAEEHIRFVMRELSHRTKNVLAVVQAMAWQTARASVDLGDFGERFTRRVDALACSHNLLTQRGWQGIRVEDLVRAQLAPFVDIFEERVDARGPDLILKPEIAQNLGLALHELATNASKFGALSCSAGKVEVGWKAVPHDQGSPQFHMIWREIGGPAVNLPTRNGFGHSIIKNVIARALDADVRLEFEPEGLTWQVVARAECILPGSPAG